MAQQTFISKLKQNRREFLIIFDFPQLVLKPTFFCLHLSDGNEQNVLFLDSSWGWSYTHVSRRAWADLLCVRCYIYDDENMKHNAWPYMEIDVFFLSAWETRCESVSNGGFRWKMCRQQHTRSATPSSRRKAENSSVEDWGKIKNISKHFRVCEFVHTSLSRFSHFLFFRLFIWEQRGSFFNNRRKIC